MSRQSYSVLISRWRSVELLWLSENSWMEVHDRPVRKIDDAEALKMFGDEAFRRRDALLEANEHAYEPRIAQLVSRRVVTALEQAGWQIEVDDSFNDFEDTFRAARGGRTMAILVPAEHRWSLQLTTEGETTRVESLLEAERWLLANGLDDAQAANLTGDIVSAISEIG